MREQKASIEELRRLKICLHNNHKDMDDILIQTRREVKRLLADIRSKYSESYVRREITNIERKLRDLEKRRQKLSDMCRRKERGLNQVANLYQQQEARIERLLGDNNRIDMKQKVPTQMYGHKSLFGDDITKIIYGHYFQQDSKNSQLKEVIDNVFEKGNNKVEAEEMKRLKKLLEDYNSLSVNQSYSAVEAKINTYHAIQKLLEELKLKLLMEVMGQGEKYSFYERLGILDVGKEGIPYDQLEKKDREQLEKVLGYSLTGEICYNVQQPAGGYMFTPYQTESSKSSPYVLTQETVEQLRERLRKEMETSRDELLEKQKYLEELRAEHETYCEKRKDEDHNYINEYYANKSEIDGTCYMYGVEVYSSWKADICGGYMMDSRYNDFGTIALREVGFTFEEVNEDVSNMTIEEYVNLMGPIWELSYKHKTLADDLEDLKVGVMIIGSFVTSYSLVLGVSGMMITETSLDVLDTGISVSQGDRVGAVIGILAIVLPEFLEIGMRGGKLVDGDALNDIIKNIDEIELKNIYKNIDEKKLKQLNKNLEAIGIQDIENLKSIQIDNGKVKIYTNDKVVEANLLDELFEGVSKLDNIGVKYSDDVMAYTYKQGKYTPIEVTLDNYEQIDNIANNMYSTFRNSADDISAIAQNTGWDLSDVEQIKKHIFLDELKLDDGIRRLDPDYEMAQAWDRLSKGEYYDHDILLLKHELYESTFYQMNDVTQRAAHDAANEFFNWQGFMQSLE